jgi:diaminopimelate decarboxylase
MEFGMARSLGVSISKVVFNGPYKKQETMEKVVLGDGMVHLDSLRDVRSIESIARQHSEKRIKIGLRCNFDIGEDLDSRFGFDVESDSFQDVLRQIDAIPNVDINGIHCHFPNRNIGSFVARIEKMLEINRECFGDKLDYINIGGGYFGNMSEYLKSQFGNHVPSYEEYAREIGSRISMHFAGVAEDKCPMLILEPGSALVADTMMFISRVVSTKRIGCRNIATIAGSSFNIAATTGNKKLPMSLIKPNAETFVEEPEFDIGGYTCIESDYVARGFKGNVEEGDFVLFDNVGSYSVVMKPPFILPNIAILQVGDEESGFKVVKRAETADDVFVTYVR